MGFTGTITSKPRYTGSISETSITIQSDSTAAYSKTVPSSAIGNATVRSFGGKSVAQNNAVVSADVTSIVSKDANNTTLSTITIPSAVRALTGYGWSAGTIYNEIDLARKKFVQRVGRVDLGSISWSYNSQYSFFSASSDCISTPYTDNPMLCGQYIYGGKNKANSAMGNQPDKTIWKRTQDYITGLATRIIVKDSAYTDASAFKTAMSGVYLYYELATPVETDISAMLSDISVPVQSGGTITFAQSNSTQLAVPSTVSYIVRPTV